MADDRLHTGEGGILYMVATPIGNLEDITLRALRILKGVDLIASESPAHTRELCSHYEIRARIISINQHNQRARAAELLKILRAGNDAAYVSNAGTPGISDPGSYIAALALQEGVKVCPVPGPSAVTSALSVSGFPAEGYLFAGFLPNRSAARRRELNNLLGERRTLVFLEAPHRIRKTLEDMQEVLGNRRITLAREMTKLHEEIRRGTVGSVLEHLKIHGPKGEFTLVVEGDPSGKACGLDEDKIVSIIDLVMGNKPSGFKETALRLAKVFDLPFRKVYRLCLERHKYSMED